MDKETILGFINEIIIENGIKNNLSSKVIRKNITDYKEYLRKNGLADEETLKAISIIEEKTDEYIDLAMSFKKAGLSIPTIGTNKTTKRKHDRKNDLGSPIGGSCTRSIPSVSSCSTTVRQSSDSCGSTLSASSCSTTIRQSSDSCGRASRSSC